MLNLILIVNTMKILIIVNGKFKISDHVETSKYKSIFAKEHAPDWSEEVIVISKTKNKVPWKYVINDLKDEEIVGIFYEKELQKTNQEEQKCN